MQYITFARRQDVEYEKVNTRSKHVGCFAHKRAKGIASVLVPRRNDLNHGNDATVAGVPNHDGFGLGVFNDPFRKGIIFARRQATVQGTRNLDDPPMMERMEGEFLFHRAIEYKCPFNR